MALVFTASVLFAYVYMYVPVPYVIVCMLLYHYMSMRTVGLEVRIGVAPRFLEARFEACRSPRVHPSF